MNIRHHLVVLVVAITLIITLLPAQGIPDMEEIDQVNEIKHWKKLADSSNYFIANMGQIDEEDILFYSSCGDIFFGSDSIDFRIREIVPIHDEKIDEDRKQNPLMEEIPDGYHERGVVLKYTFVGSNNVIPIGRERCSWNTNYFKGGDPEGWHTELPNFNEVVYHDLWDGIDLVYRLKEGSPKYDLVVSPGADPSDIGFRIEGHESLSIDDNGNLVIGTGFTDVLDTGLYAYQKGSGKVNCQFIIKGRDQYGFGVTNFRSDRELVIDPLLGCSTFIGGSGDDMGTSIDTDVSGNIFITGYTGDDTTDYPTTSGTYDTTHNGLVDLFVSKMDPLGKSLLYSTFIGGAGNDEGHGIIVDSNGNAIVIGVTDDRTPAYPTTTGAYDTTHNGLVDVVLTKLNPTGSSLVFSTFIGGEDEDQGWDIDLDDRGDIYITGFTYDSGTDYPTTSGAYDTTHNGAYDVFASKIKSDGSSLLYSTFIGGSADDRGWGICLDPNGNAYISGDTWLSDYPTTSGAFDTTFNGGSDAFITKLNPSGSSISYSTFIGGSDNEYSWRICLDSTKNAYITGITGSILAPVGDYPTTTGAYDTTHNGLDDAFVTKINSAGTSLVYSTFLGGTDDDRGQNLIVEGGGSAYVTGCTYSTDYPTTKDAYDTTQNGDMDVFLTKVDASGSGLGYSTYIGGTGSDFVIGLCDHFGTTMHISGRTLPGRPNYPVTKGSYDTTHNGNSDAFLTSFIFEPTEPLEVYSLGAYSGPSCYDEIEWIDIGETIFIQLLGLDNNATYKGTATVNITSTITVTVPVVISLIETDLNSGVYRGSFPVTPVFQYLENITIESRKDPSKSTIVQVNTPIQIRPFIDNISCMEDDATEYSFWTFGYNPASSWSFNTNANWLDWDGSGSMMSGTPDNSMVGTYWVNISVSDAFGNLDHLNISIEVVNTPPGILTENDATATEDEEYFIDYQCDDEGCGSTFWSIYKPHADWLEFDTITGILQGTPRNDDVDLYAINISVDDGNGGTNWTSFVLHVADINDPPIIQTVPYTSVLQGDNYYIEMNARDEDDLNVFEWLIITDAEFLEIDNITGVLTGDPGNDDVGLYFVNITAVDLRGLTDSINFTLEVIDINDPPEWVDVPMDSKIEEGIHFQFQMKAVDVDRDDQIEYSVKTNPASDMSIDPVTGLLKWRATINGLDPDMSYTLNIQVTASDGDLERIHGFYLRVVPNELPWATLISPGQDGRVASTGAILEWGGKDNEDSQLSYFLYVHEDRVKVENLDIDALVEGNLTDTSFEFVGIVSGKTYFWTVIPMDDLRLGFCDSGIGSFYANTIPTLQTELTLSVIAGAKISHDLLPSDPDPGDLDKLDLTLIDAVDDEMYLVENVIIWENTHGKEGNYTVAVMISDRIESSEITLLITIEEAEIIDVEDEEDDSGLMIGLVVGSAILLMIAIIAVIIFLVVRKGKKKPDETEEDEETPPSSDDTGSEIRDQEYTDP